LSLQWSLDTLFTEPYVVPYAIAGVYILDHEESKIEDVTNAEGEVEPTVVTLKGTTAPALSYSAGLLIQLNILERQASLHSYKDWGLENAYLDLRITQYARSQRASDPEFGSAPQLGAGFRLEY